MAFSLRSVPGHRYALYVAAWVVLLAAPASSQEVETLDPELSLTQFVHDRWTAEDGLPQNTVSAVAQTRDGYLWIGTQDGLVRFDGARFQVYNKSDGLGNNEVRALLADDDGSLWIGTYGGGLTRMVDGELTTFTSRDGLPNDHVRALYQDREGILWIGTIEGGLGRYDGESFSTISTRDGLAGDVVLAIAETSSGDLWIGTQAGLSRLRQGSLTSFTRRDGLPGDVVWSLEVDADDNLWVGAIGGLARFRDGRIEPVAPSCGEAVSAIYEDAAGTIWVGTLGDGLCRYVDGHLHRFSAQEGLSNNRIRAIVPDAEGNLWIGTESAGLNRLRQGKFIHYSESEGLADNMAFTVLEDRRGDMWIGTMNAGITRIDASGTEHFSTADGLGSNQVYALHEGMQGEIWVGTYGGGLCRIYRGDVSCLTSEDGLPSDNVYALYEQSDGTLWTGTDAGLATMRDGRAVPYQGDDHLASVPITVIYGDGRGTVWVGSYGGGLQRIHPDGVQHFRPEDGFVDGDVLVLKEDAEGRLWAGTHGDGVCLIDGSDANCLTTADGLPSDVVVQIIEDDQGRLWVGTMQGIVRFAVINAVSVLNDRSTSLETTTFGRGDGLKASELNGGTQPSAWKSRDGRLWFTTNYGVAVVDPAAMRANTLPPYVHVEGMNINGKPADVEDDLTLDPGARDITFHYTGISLTASEKVQFKYKLEGYNEDWVDAGNRRDAYYTNLAPGPYTFRVKAANNDGVWNEEGTSVSIYLRPYFYQTWWFAVLCGLAALGCTSAGFRLRVRQLRVRARGLELEHQVGERTQELRREKERTEQAKQVIELQASKLRDLNDDLEKQAEKLRDLNDNLQAKVREQFRLLVEQRERYEASLIDAKNRAEASDRLKTAILNNLSHEFRTPLTAILGFTEIVAREAPAHLEEFTSEIHRAGRRLLRTLDALLEFSRLEANEPGMRPRRVDVTTAAAGVVHDFRMQAERKNLQLRFKASAPARALLDASAVEEIIWNLVDNAVKFTPEGEVVVSVGTEGERAFVRVRDTGVGIGEAFVDRMFEAFAQESDGFDRAFEGVGLGLTITKRLVEHLNGEIDVESRPGEGSTFTVYFPVGEAVASAA